MSYVDVMNGRSMGQSVTGRQQGAVLVFALLLLLVMTVLGVSSVGNSVLEERMSGNFHQSTSALQSAEVALRVAEDWLGGPAKTKGKDALDWFAKGADKKQGLYSTQASPGKNFPCIDNVTELLKAGCIFDPTNESHWTLGGTDELPNDFVTLGADDLSTGKLAAIDPKMVSQQPRFIIEYIGRAGEYVGNLAIGSQAAPDIRKYAFRVTAIGWGRDANARYVLQSHFLVPL